MLFKIRLLQSINIGSMSDLGFLLLVFFIINTTYPEQKGLKVTLAQWVDTDFGIIRCGGGRNSLQIIVTKNDQLFVNGEKFDVENLRVKMIQYVTNNGTDLSMSRSPLHAVVQLTNDNGCSYDQYLKVSNEIYAAYHEIWEEAAKADYGKGWDRLSDAEQSTIRQKFPRVIVETETFFD